MPEDIKIVQFEDKEFNPIAPLTIAKAVNLSYGKNLQEQVDYMNIDVIREDETEVLESIENATDSSIGEIDFAGGEYRTDIDDLAIKVAALDAKEFPLKISYTILPDFTGTYYSKRIVCNIGEHPGKDPVLTSFEISKKINDSTTPIVIYNPSDPSSHIDINDNVDGMRETITFEVHTKLKESTSTTTRYLCFFGASNTENMTSDIALGLGKTLSSSVSFNPTITTEYGDYIWLIVPRYLSITNVKSSGFDVTLADDPQTLNIGNFGTFKAYRTLKRLDESDWSLIIT